MTFINTCADVDDLGGGRFRHTQYVKPVAYDDNGTLRAIASALTASGVADRPHTVRAARLMTSVADDGMRRIHPTREEDRYVEIGTPYVKVGGVWRKMGFRGGMRTANRLAWMSPQANMSIVHAGHYVKLEIELKGKYVPEDNLIAFPVDIRGFTRKGGIIYDNGQPVLNLRPPMMYDADNATDVRPIDGKFTTLDGQPYYLMTLPALLGMRRPVVDPTLTLQPDASAGKDTYANQFTATTNYGTGTDLKTTNGPEVAFLGFDVSDIPSTATVSTATLTITSTTSRSEVPKTVYSLACGVADWTESGLTWNNYKADTAWPGSGGGWTSGTDFEATAIGSYTHPATVGTPVDVTLTVARVQGWVTDGSNYGMTLRNATYGTGGYERNVGSSDHATLSYRPKLVVEYTLPGGGNIFQSAILHSSFYGKTLVR